MSVDDCYQLGYVVKPHGLKGEVQIFLDVDSPQEYNELESVFVLRGQQLVPFFIESIAVRGDKAIVAFEDVETVEEAKGLKSAALYLPLDSLPELDDESFYYHDLVNYSLVDKEQQVIGKISAVLDTGAQELLEVKHDSGKEILVPLSDELIIKVDKQNQVLVMEIPEGLVDVYLNED